MFKNKEGILSGVFKYSIATWINLIMGFLSMILMTRLIPPDIYGQLCIFYSVTNVLMYIIAFGMDGALIRFYNEPPGNNTRQQLLYKNIIYELFICFVLGIISIFIFGNFLSKEIFSIVSKTLIGLVYIQSISMLILRNLNISFRMSFRAKQYTIQNILTTNLSRFCVIIAALLCQDTEFIICILVISTVVLLLPYLYIQRKEFIPYNKQGNIKWSLSTNGYWEYLKFSFYSAPSYIINYLNIYVGQQVIVSTVGAYGLGIYSSTAMFNHILTAIYGGFSTFWSAYVYKNYKNKQEKISEMHNYVVLTAILILSMMIVSRDIIYLFIGEQYHESKNFYSLLMIMPILMFVSETTSKGIAIAKKNHISMIITILGATINVALCIYFSQQWGLRGAAIANAVSALVLYMLNTYFGQRYYKSILSRSMSFVGISCIICLALIAFFIKNILWIIIGVLITDMLACLFFRQQIITIIKNIQ